MFVWNVKKVAHYTCDFLLEASAYDRVKPKWDKLM